MTSDGLFLENDQMRPIWRFLLSLVVIFASIIFTSWIVGTAYLIANVHPGMAANLFWQSLTCLFVLMAAFKAMMSMFDHRTLVSMGLAFFAGWQRQLVHGILVGGAMLLLVVLLEMSCGSLRFSVIPQASLASSGLFSIIFFAIAAAKEEIIFRGYAFQRLAESVTPAGAIAVSSAFFGVAHLANPHRTWISTVNTMLVAIPFCIAYLRTRSLWMPIGMHFIWNLLQGFVFGLPVSGLVLSASVLTSHVQGAVWLTGGAYGPEASLLAMVAILVGIIYLATMKSIYTNEEMKNLLLAPATQRNEPPISLFSALPREEAKRD